MPADFAGTKEELEKFIREIELEPDQPNYSLKIRLLRDALDNERYKGGKNHRSDPPIKQSRRKLPER